MADTDPTHTAAGRGLIAELRSLLGSKLVAYLTEAIDTRTVREWADGTAPLPDQGILDRLQVALDAVRLITVRDSAVVAQSWFEGRNPALNDQPPAQLLRDADLDSTRNAVLAAANEFATHGC